MVVLFFAQLSLLVLVFVERERERENAWGIAWVKALLALFALVIVSTELLSFIGGIGSTTVAIFWMLTLIVSSYWLFKERAFASLKIGVIPWKKALWLVPCFFIVIGTFLSGILFPPNNYDSMTYHLARVSHWIENGSVAFFPTAIIRQNYQMPLAEYAIMHLKLLGGGDSFAFIVQWLCFIGTLCNGYLIVSEYSKDWYLKLGSLYFFACTPMAILQASSTQNDVVLSFFLSAMALFLLRLRKDFSVSNALFAAVAMGAALLTKGTAYLYIPPIAICISLGCLRPWKGERFVALCGVAFLALLLNAGHYTRNYELYGHPLSTEGSPYVNEAFTLDTLYSNAVRNLAIHLPTQSETWNSKVYESVYGILGDEMNDPATTWKGTKFVSRYNRHEDGSGNLLHVMLFAAVFPVMLFEAVRRGNRSLLALALGVVGGALFFCLILKWQPWHSRLHTPLFSLMGPIVALTLESVVQGRKRILVVLTLVAGLFFYACPYVYDNKPRSLVRMKWADRDRVDLYFHNNPHLAREYLDVVEILKDREISELGFYAGENDWEYPLWMLLNEHRNVSLRHFGVANASRVLEDKSWQPEFVVATRSFGGDGYQVIYSSDRVTVFERIDETVFE